MQILFPLNILESFCVKDIVLCRKVGFFQKMTPIHFEITRSHVKVTVAINSKTVSAQYLAKFMSDSHSIWYKDWSWSLDDPLHF